MTATLSAPLMTEATSAPDTPETPPTRSKTELCLFAPYNEIVQLIASWTDWKPLDMKRGEDGWWRIDADLPDGEHYYKFRVKSRSYFCRDQMQDIFDPYALSITKDQHQAGIMVIKNGRRQWVDYRWQHDAVPLPANGQLVIYELHVGDFAGPARKGNGRFADVLDKLDYLASLNINCIELMPVKQFPGKSWGYCLDSLFGVENRYGKPEDLCRLVDECHARGIRVMVDGVYNHADKDAPLTRIDYGYWFYEKNPDPPEMDWGPKYNYAFFDEKLKIFPARKYVIDSIKFWVEKFHIDGIRFDATRAIRDFPVLRELADAGYDKVNGAKHFWTVAEHVPEDPAITGRDRGAPMDAAWHDGLGRHLQAVASLTEQAGNQPFDLDGLIQKFNPATNGYEKPDRIVNFIGNHDYKRVMTIIGEDGKIFDDAAFRRMKLATGLLFTAPGIPMIWMGQEFGFSSDKSLDPRPLDWDLLKNDPNSDLLKFHQNLIKLRRETPALQGETFEVLLKDTDRKILAFKRWNGEGNVAIVLANLNDKFAGEVTLEGPCLDDGPWHEFFRNYDVEVKDHKLTDTLSESEIKIFIRK